MDEREDCWWWSRASWRRRSLSFPTDLELMAFAPAGLDDTLSPRTATFHPPTAPWATSSVSRSSPRGVSPCRATEQPAAIPVPPSSLTTRWPASLSVLSRSLPLSRGHPDVCRPVPGDARLLGRLGRPPIELGVQDRRRYLYALSQDNSPSLRARLSLSLGDRRGRPGADASPLPSSPRMASCFSSQKGRPGSPRASLLPLPVVDYGRRRADLTRTLLPSSLPSRLPLIQDHQLPPPQPHQAQAAGEAGRPGVAPPGSVSRRPPLPLGGRADVFGSELPADFVSPRTLLSPSPPTPNTHILHLRRLQVDATLTTMKPWLSISLSSRSLLRREKRSASWVDDPRLDSAAETARRTPPPPLLQAPVRDVGWRGRSLTLAGMSQTWGAAPRLSMVVSPLSRRIVRLVVASRWISGATPPPERAGLDRSTRHLLVDFDSQHPSE